MASFIGNKFNTYNARAFANEFANDSIYLYVGQVLTWEDEDAPPTANDTTYDHNKIWDNMVGAVRVTRDQVSLGIKRNDWATGKVYDRYHHANTTLGDNFYVLAGAMDRDVYKCLDNNGRTQSSVKPSHKNFGATKEKDGYVWKYMYSIPDSTFTQFATLNVIPTFINSLVASRAKPGSILHLPISANNTAGIGKDYRGTGFSNGTVSVFAVNASIQTTVFANSTASEITIAADSGLSTQDNYFNESAFLVTSGKAKGTYRIIVDSKAGGSDATSNLVLSSVVSNFANGDTFIIGPRVSIDDVGGRGFLGIGKMNSSGNLTSVEVSLTGKLYANGDSTVVIDGDYEVTGLDFPDGSGATVELILSPPGGHGYNSHAELNAKYVIISPETPIVKDHQTGSFVGHGNEIRQIGLLRNPIERYRYLRGDKFSYDLRTTIYFAHPTEINFAKDQRVYNRLIEGTETASGTVSAICGDANKQYISLTGVQGLFFSGDVLHNRLGDSAVISGTNLAYYSYPSSSLSTSPDSAIMEGGLTKYMGDILYHENISPITRRLDQKENFKFVFEF